MRRLWTTCAAFLLGMAFLLGAPLPSKSQPNVTSYRRMTAQLQADAARSPLVRVASLGHSARARRDLWLVRLADSAADPAKNLRVLVLCRQHGDEPASTESVLGLIQRLAAGGDPALRAELARVTLYVVPMVNPDGAEANTRNNGVGADLNRDWGVFHQPETRAVAQAVRLLRPNIVIDAHNWDGGDEYNADCLEVARAAATPLERAGHLLQRQTVGDLAASGYAVHPTAWGGDTDPRLAHRWFARRNILSALVETHSGSPADTADFERRQGMYAVLIHSLLRHYSAAYAVEKPRLEQMENDPSSGVQEAALFTSALPAAAPHRSLAFHRPPLAWLWAIGVFGLTLWGASLNPAGKNLSQQAALFFRKERGGGKHSSRKPFGCLPSFGQRRRRASRRMSVRAFPTATLPALGSGTAPKPGCAPASGRRSAARPGKRRCQC